MQICDHDHDEIVYDSRLGHRTQCPLCNLMSEHADEIRELKAKIAKLEDTE